MVGLYFINLATGLMIAYISKSIHHLVLTSIFFPCVDFNISNLDNNEIQVRAIDEIPWSNSTNTNICPAHNSFIIAIPSMEERNRNEYPSITSSFFLYPYSLALVLIVCFIILLCTAMMKEKDNLWILPNYSYRFSPHSLCYNI